MSMLNVFLTQIFSNDLYKLLVLVPVKKESFAVGHFLIVHNVFLITLGLDFATHTLGLVCRSSRSGPTRFCLA
jgi:hypothetical protein